MNEERRGLKMIAGIAVIAIALHLMFNQLFSEAGLMLACVFGWDPPVSSTGEVGLSPAALLFSVGIELVIAIGSVALLVLSGLWDGAVVIIRWTTDVLKIANEHLSAWRAEREASEQAKVEEAPAESPEEVQVVGEVDTATEDTEAEVELSADELLLFAVKDIRDRLAALELNQLELSKANDDLAVIASLEDFEAIDDLEDFEPEVTTTSRPLDPDSPEIAPGSVISKPFPPSDKE